ncbi:lipase family protein [Nocardia sp. NPDC052566]|uniref:lipase family protein n=1 Tax=Nocardia sp. NPDC052566 TaxID=3364330 RepID=UPI0037C55058
MIASMITLVGGSPATAEPVFPTADPFYDYSGELADAGPGTILRQRAISLRVDGVPVPAAAEQVLYRTTDELGRPSATVATIARPLAPAPTLRMVSYQMAYDALGPQCQPSYALQGGGSPTSLAALEANIVMAYLANGFTVVLPDYEGEGLAFAAGQESGYATIDGIRAALHSLAAPPTTPVGLVGYSGGSIATEFAAELAPSYAPELNIVGAAAGGPPVYLPHNLDYIDGSAKWASVIPFAFVGVSRGFDFDPAPYLSDYGATVLSEVAGTCFGDVEKPGLTVAQMLRPANPSYRDIPPLMTILERLRMGANGTPRGPLLLGVGNSDGIGDGVMVAADVRALAADYCARGLTVQFREYSGLDHTGAIAPFAADALAYITARLDNQPPPNTC